MSDTTPHATIQTPTSVAHAAAGAHLASSLTQSTQPSARIDVARSRWLTGHLARRLARSARADVRAAVAANPQTPAAVLAKLSGDRHHLVRAAAVTNPSCPLDVVLAHPDSDPLMHPDCPADLLIAAVTGPRRSRRSEALAHPNLPAPYRDPAELSGTTELWALLENPATTHDDARQIFTALRPDAISVGHWKWSEHPHADPTWLAELAADATSHTDQSMIVHIARNPATPVTALAAIVDKHTGYADRFALANPSCPPTAMHAALDRTPEADQRVMRSSHNERATLIALNRAATCGVLTRIPATRISGIRLYTFVETHADTAAHARGILALADGWTGTLADLLDTAAAVTETETETETAA